jgi:hypothetical protein
MKTILVASIAVFALSSLPAHAGIAIINLGIGGEISPGVYGQVQIGNAPPPPVLYAQPVIIVRQKRSVEAQPLYLHVPPGHAKHWSKHCREYNACNRPVYFVRSAEYEPGYNAREYKRKHRDRDRKDHRDRGRDHRD